MEVDKIPIAEIIPYDKNPRKNERAVSVVAKSIKEFGFRNPIILDKNNVVVAGHTRLLAAKKLKLTEVPVIWADDLTPEQVKAFRIMDNKSSEYSEWDLPLLKLELEGLDELEIDTELSGFSFAEIGDILDKEINEDDFEMPKEAKYEIVPQEIWVLGNHRLMCGDVIKKEDLKKLMNGEKADMIFVDPPYNIGYKYEKWDDKFSPEGYKEWCKKWMINLREFSSGNIILTLGHANIGMWYEIDNPLAMATWIKKNAVTGSKIAKTSIWEPIIFFWDYRSKKRDFDVYEYNLKRQDIGETKKEHSCPKQLNLISDFVKSYSNNNELWLDSFGGSGTTLIACEQLNRKCYMMEIDPFYCSVIIERWEKLTNKKGVKL